MNLYEILGVARDATRAAIKRAYRARARAVHPDSGGRPGEFAALALAYRTLSDEAQRAQYDATGEVETGPSPEDQLRAEVLGFLTHHWHAMLAQEGLDLFKLDVRQQLADIAANQLASVDAAIANLKQLEQRTEKVLARWKKKSEGGNLMAGMTQDFLANVQGKLKHITHARELFLAAQKLLEDYEFDFEPAPPPDPAPPDLRQQTITFTMDAGRFFIQRG